MGLSPAAWRMTSTSVHTADYNSRRSAFGITVELVTIELATISPLLKSSQSSFARGPPPAEASPPGPL